ncbi:uncharacterized protein LOC115771541 [Drosophila novamexicana]|uniref:uncharacterized protein LOC115771541 n=1 Tax=Drosophila novamexicana TaxID=47314 RepID=UPI0011E58CEC|nr:uncharacterized protein LOC115771541 [Drosophila novamexicana]
MNTTSSVHNFERHFAPGGTSTPVHTTLSPLHKALIEYATTSARLLFIQDPAVYADFHSTNEAFNEYTSMELCEIMLNSVLPKVHTYPLTATIKKRLKLLELHPCFQRTPQGYQYTPQRLGAHFVLQPKCDFSLPEQLPKLLSSQGNRPGRASSQKHALTGSRDASHTMLIGSDKVTHVGRKFQLSFDIAALLSPMLSSHSEYSVSELHNVTKIKKRLQSAKHSFQATGNMSPYRNNLQQLINNMIMFDMVKKRLYRSLFNL